MRDPISGPVELAFFGLSFLVALWIAIDPRRVLEFLFASVRPISASIVAALRVLAGICAVGLAVLLVRHTLGFR